MNTTICTDYADIRSALALIMGAGAATKDDKGFNACDAAFARDLQRQKRWTLKQARAVHRMLQKYQAQLHRHGIDYAAIPRPAENPGAEKARAETEYKRLRRNGDGLELTFRCERTGDFYDVLAKVKTISGGRFDKDRKCWRLPLQRYAYEDALKLGFVGDIETEKWYAETRAVGAAVIDNAPEMYRFQIDGVNAIERMGGRSLLADEMGLGKTCQAIVYAKAHPEMRPLLVVCPASLKINWEREFRKWGVDEPVKVVSGKCDIGGANIVIINYDLLERYLERLEAIGFKLIVFDESHMLKNLKTKRTKAARVLAKSVPHIICVSGTPIVNRPIELYTSLNMINPEMFPSFYAFAQRYCQPSYNGFGWTYNGASNTEELHDLLKRTFMIRRLKSEVLTQLPPKQRQVVAMDIVNREEYDRAEADLIAYIHRTEGAEAAAKASMAEALVYFEKMKQLAAKGKFDQAMEWIENFIEEQKLVVFCTHHDIIDAVMDRFGDVAVKLDGRDAKTSRQRAVDAFQSDDKIRLFVGNLKAAGVGITLTAASNTCFIELGWTPGDHDQAEDRVHRIGQTAESVGAYYLVATSTIEEDLAQLIDEKRKVLTSVLDGNAPADESMISILLERYGRK